MSEDQFTKLFRYIQSRFDDLEKKLDAKADREQVDQLIVALDGIAGRLDTDEQERSAITHQLGRHADWIGQLAQKTGTKLTPELK